MGPAPMIPTVSPSLTAERRTARTATEQGSVSAATASGTASGMACRLHASASVYSA